MESKLNKKQLSAVQQFLEFTASRNKQQAVDILKDVKWNVEQAVEIFYSNYGGSDQMEDVPVAVSAPKQAVDSSSIKGTFSRKGLSGY